ncbi:MAG TPA: hypothetical protein VMJ12_11115 [Candidatus Acidoferrales bacterium]|nr:hypothetical protein [Candidatus Acidoferrales bacterium]
MKPFQLYHARIPERPRASAPGRAGRLAFWLIAMGLMAFGARVLADDTNSPALSPQDYFEGGPSTYNNWMALTAGGLLTSGNQAQAQQSLHMDTGAFGGIEDLHFQGNAFTNTLFTLDGHSIIDDHDYQLKLGLTHPDLWFLRFNFENFRTWYNDAGGYYPPTGTTYSGPSDALALDRGEISFEGGLTLQKLPALTFKYTHSYRDGEKSSTIWSPVHPDLFTDPTLTQGLGPSSYDIDEKIDTFQLNATQHVKETDLALGLRYQTANLNDALYTTRYLTDPVPPNAAYVTDRQKTTYNLFDLNASSETWIKPNLLFSTGFLFANLNNDLSGDRIYGDGDNVSYIPTPSSGLGYTNLVGNSHMKEYVLDMNLMTIPLKTVTIVPAIRVQQENWDANSSGIGTLSTFPTDPFSSQSSRDVIDVAESLDARYTGVTNWVFSARGEWTEGQGNLTQNGGLTQVAGIGVPSVLTSGETDDNRFFQKYSLGARWYPFRRLTIDVGGYYQNNRYNYTNPTNSAANDFSMQSFQTYDGNVRITVHPRYNVTLGGRYEYQFSTVYTQPDPASGLNEVQSAEIPSQIIGGNATWTPWSRLSLQAGLDYVLSQTKTPVTDFTNSVLNLNNNYWTVNFSSDFVVDDKTDLNVSYFYYQADDFQNNSPNGVALGAGAHENGVNATLTRRLTQNLRASLKYGFYDYVDVASGGFNSFKANLIFATLQYRF